MTVLGYDTAAQLFPGQSAIGKEVEAAGMLFTVVGVLDKQKQAFGGGNNPQDNQAFFPHHDVPLHASGAAGLLDHAEVRRSEEPRRWWRTS